MCTGVLPVCVCSFFSPLKRIHVLLACICPCLAPGRCREAEIQAACELTRGCWQLNPGLQKSSQCSSTPNTLVSESLSQGLTTKLTDSARLAVQMSFQRSTWLPLSTCRDYRQMWPCSTFYMKSADLNSGHTPAGLALYQLSHLPSPNPTFISKQKYQNHVCVHRHMRNF